MCQEFCIQVNVNCVDIDMKTLQPHSCNLSATNEVDGFALQQIIIDLNFHCHHLVSLLI